MSYEEAIRTGYVYPTAQEAQAAYDEWLSSRKVLRPKAAKKRGKWKAFTRPQASDSLAVPDPTPTRVAAAEAHAKKNGVPTEYRPDGRPLITSAFHQRALAKLHGYKPKRDYY